EQLHARVRDVAQLLEVRTVVVDLMGAHPVGPDAHIEDLFRLRIARVDRGLAPLWMNAEPVAEVREYHRRKARHDLYPDPPERPPVKRLPPERARAERDRVAITMGFVVGDVIAHPGLAPHPSAGGGHPATERLRVGDSDFSAFAADACEYWKSGDVSAGIEKERRAFAGRDAPARGLTVERI